MRLSKLFMGVLLAAGVSAVARGDAATKKFNWNPINGAQDTDVSDGTIVVSQVEFDLGATMKGTPIRKSSAKAKVRIDNNGQTDQEVGVAVVVFDSEGNVVAAGSNGTKWGYLSKGDRTYYDIDFPYVYRNLDKAASFVVTLETRSKGTSKKTKYTSTTTETTSEVEPAPAQQTKSVATETETAPPPPQKNVTVKSEDLKPNP
ncbi:MAG TPA: hypothetical protein VH854_09470 [Thermoanaerobaculia bacterium]|nr:hypothetical protein [Thermoanaerobaculia bacterium]